MSETTKVAVFACGGCGINMLKNVLKSKFEMPKDVSLSAIDTSESNIDGLPENVIFTKVSSLGSGKDRSVNANLIYDQIESMDISESLGDINIIVSSFAGGTGGLISNMLANKIIQSDMAAIVMGVVDYASQKACENSINTIKTFENFAKQNNSYFSLALYNNMDAGRKAVNKNVAGDMAMFIDLFNSDIEEMDHMDKMHFLNPSKVNKSLSGVFAIGITDNNTFDAADGANTLSLIPAEMFHAVMCVNGDGMPVPVNAMIDYVGIREKTNYIVVNGVGLDAKLLKTLKSKYDGYVNRAASVSKLDILETESTESNGIVY